MARKTNSATVFNWVIELQGLDSFECQSVTIPSPEVGSIEQGSGGYIVKTAGLMNVGDLTFTKLKPVDSADSKAWDWLAKVRNPKDGTGNSPQFYEEDITVKLLAADKSTTLYAWYLTGVWIKKIEYNEFSKTAEENVVETITCSVDTIEQTKVPTA